MNDRWLKRLWLVNGVILLLFMLLVGSLIAVDTFQRWFNGDDRAVALPKSTRAPAHEIRALRFDPPVHVRGTRSQLVRVRYGSAFAPADDFGVAGFSSASGYSIQPVVNVLLVDPRGSASLLLDSPAYFKNIEFPSERRDSLQTWISYEVALEDTNGDGRLGEADDLALYITGLDGGSLRRVSPDGYAVTWHGPFDDGRSILIYALDTSLRGKLQAQQQLPQRAFRYLVSADSLGPFEDLNRAVQAAAQLFSR